MGSSNRYDIGLATRSRMAFCLAVRGLLWSSVTSLHSLSSRPAYRRAARSLSGGCSAHALDVGRRPLGRLQCSVAAGVGLEAVQRGDVAVVPGPADGVPADVTLPPLAGHEERAVLQREDVLHDPALEEPHRVRAEVVLADLGVGVLDGLDAEECHGLTLSLGSNVSHVSARSEQTVHGRGQGPCAILLLRARLAQPRLRTSGSRFSTSSAS